MKTLVFADDLLIWMEEEKERKGNLIMWNLVTMEHLLKMNMDCNHDDFMQVRHKFQYIINKRVTEYNYKFIWKYE
jgi:hypothetical protein